jgi:hypothetical protein
MRYRTVLPFRSETETMTEQLALNDPPAHENLGERDPTGLMGPGASRP